MNLGNDSDDYAPDCISTLMMPLDNTDYIRVQNSLHGVGPNNEILSIIHPHSVSYGSMIRMCPGAWSNDDIINFHAEAIAKRDVELKESNHYHFFNSNFLPNVWMKMDANILT